MKQKYNNKINKNKKDLFPVRVRGLSVDPSRHRTFESAMSKWVRKVQDDGKMEEVRARRYYEKPSVTRRKRKALAQLKEKYRRINAQPERQS